LIDYITEISDKAGISVVTKFDPFLPLVTKGLDLIAGRNRETEIELALSTDMLLTKSCFCALVARPKDEIVDASLTIDANDRRLLCNGEPLQAAYCVFSIRSSDKNPEWGSIPALREAYADFNRAIVSSGQRHQGQEALAAFNRQVLVSADLISTDKEILKSKERFGMRTWSWRRSVVTATNSPMIAQKGTKEVRPSSVISARSSLLLP